MKRPMPPDALIDLEPVDGLDFEPAKNLKEWILATFISDSGELHNPDHAHIAPWDDDLFQVLWASSAFIKAEQVVLGQTEKIMFNAGGWKKARQEKQMIDWFGYIPKFLITIDAKYAATASDTDFCALIEHELYHVGAKRDEDGNYIVSPLTGEYKYYLRGHDVEEFHGVVERYGASEQVSKMVELANNGPTIGKARIAHACGTCLLKLA
ncbi:putative metallopeptidase [Acinetobacter sp. ANC 4641]|uniref:putative metallopeptidase n=1 Tax=Acinetobacter sp. ANC 4641 TaxID=2529847 RepID=UPI00103E63D0|nr:putative metallopeptidase [Acinetobacter sp. ANC 4641]TCB11450.1 transposase [Acinetobacter sp. ANC 4641]